MQDKSSKIALVAALAKQGRRICQHGDCRARCWGRTLFCREHYVVCSDVSACKDTVGGKPRSVCLVDGCDETCEIYHTKARGQQISKKCRNHRLEDKRAKDKRFPKSLAAQRRIMERVLFKQKNDPEYRASYLLEKFRRRVRTRIKKYCTVAYLRNARAEDERHEKALKIWLEERKPVFTEEERRRRKAESSWAIYWENPEEQRERIRAYKKNNPDQKRKWDIKRLERQRKQSDGTVTRESLMALYDGSPECPYCGDPYLKSGKSPDHMQPLSRDGKHSISNILICCVDCNVKKGDRTAEEFLCYLRERHWAA